MKQFIYFLIILLLLIILIKCLNKEETVKYNLFEYSTNCPYCKNIGCDCLERFGCRKGASGQTICD